MSKVIEVDVFYDLLYADHIVYFARDDASRTKGRPLTRRNLRLLCKALEGTIGVTTPHFDGWRWKRTEAKRVCPSCGALLRLRDAYLYSILGQHRVIGSCARCKKALEAEVEIKSKPIEVPF